MSATAGTVLVVMFIYGAILWQREQVIDRLADDVEALEREVGLMLGRERSRDEYLGIEVNDPVPDGPGEWVADEDPDTEEMPAVDPDPATQPDLKAAASVGPVPALTWEERQQQFDAEWQAIRDGV